MPAESEVWSRRDSWPPTQMRLNSSVVKSSSDPSPLLQDIDDNPLTYFLTPTVDNEVDVFGDDGMDFDAGIEDSSHPHETVRSVSPSSLEGLSKPRARAGSPDYDSDGPGTDDDDDDDDDDEFMHTYMRLSPRRLSSRPARLGSVAVDGRRLRPRRPAFGRSADGLLSPASYPAAQPRGRPLARARQRPGRLWREPSPDVWSIEEETEEEMKKSQEGLEEAAVEKTAAKPKKKVRFLLPAKK